MTDTITNDIDSLVTSCRKLADKHNAFIRRSKWSDELMYTIDGEIRSTMDWNVIHDDLIQLETRESTNV